MFNANIYTLKAPTSEGSYSFSGIYSIDGMDEPGQIGGQASVSVSSTAMDSNILIMVAIIVIVIVVLFVLLRMKKFPKK